MFVCLFVCLIVCLCVCCNGFDVVMSSYHEATLDKDIIATTWEDDNTTLGASRELRFLKPVALPGLTHARAKKVSVCS